MSEHLSAKYIMRYIYLHLLNELLHIVRTSVFSDSISLKNITNSCEIETPAHESKMEAVQLLITTQIILTSFTH